MSDLAWARPKLAELCGYATTAGYYVHKDYKRNLEIGNWEPEKRVDQAIRCLEALRPAWQCLVDQNYMDGWCVELVEKVPTGRGTILVDDPKNTLPQNIVLAIIAAMQWEAP